MENELLEITIIDKAALVFMWVEWAKDKGFILDYYNIGHNWM